MNLYVKYDEVRLFYFKLILFLYMEDQRKNNKISYSYVPTIYKNEFRNIFLLENKDMRQTTKEILIFFNYEDENVKKFINRNNIEYNVRITVCYTDNESSNKAIITNENVFKEIFSENLLFELKELNERNLTEKIREYMKSDLFCDIMSPYSERSIDVHELKKIYYKYKGTNGYNVQEMINGEITYTSPTKFNDPFDCDFDVIDFHKKTIHLKDKFRVLCATPKMNDILMWGYYGNNHDGVCVGHELSDYIRTTQDNYSGLLFYDKVLYKTTRPEYKCDKRYLKQLPITDLLDKVVKCCFTKFKDWEREDEFRILAFSNAFEIDDNHSCSSNLDFINLKGVTSEVYLGVNYSGTFMISSNKRRFVKDDVDYILNIV